MSCGYFCTAQTAAQVDRIVMAAKKKSCLTLSQVLDEAVDQRNLVSLVIRYLRMKRIKFLDGLLAVVPF